MTRISVGDGGRERANMTRCGWDLRCSRSPAENRRKPGVRAFRTRGFFEERFLYGPNLVNAAPADYKGARPHKVGCVGGWYAFQKIFDWRRRGGDARSGNAGGLSGVGRRGISVRI